MVDSPEFERWRAAADDALRGAGVQADAGLHQWACFLAEQAAQLAVKGILHGLGSPGWGHDVVALGGHLAETWGAPLSEDVEAALRRLSRHYIPARYPDAHPSGKPGAYYGPTDSRQALDDVALVLHRVDNIWQSLK